MQVAIDSLMTRYDRHGDTKQKKILLLHGWADNSNSWQEVHEHLANQYDVVALDLPGFGGTRASDDVWGLDDYANFVANFLRKINVKPFAIIAHSTGGAVAVRGLSHGLIHAQRLVLLNSAGIRTEYKVRKQALRIITKTGKLLTYPLPKGVKKRLRQKVYSTVGSDMLVAEHMQETFKRIVTDDIQLDAAKLELPTLLVYGEDDLTTPVQYGKILHHLIKGSQLEIVPFAGHFAHLDKPIETLRLIEKFIAS